MKPCIVIFSDTSNRCKFVYEVIKDILINQETIEKTDTKNFTIESKEFYYVFVPLNGDIGKHLYHFRNTVAFCFYGLEEPVYHKVMPNILRWKSVEEIVLRCLPKAKDLGYLELIDLLGRGNITDILKEEY